MSRPSLVEMAKLPTISTPQYVVRTHNIAADITCFSLNSGDYVPYHVMQSSTAVESSTSSTPQSMSAPEVQSHQSTNPSADDLKVKDRLHAESSSLKSSSFSPLMQPRLAALAGEHTKSMYSTNQVSAIRSAPDNMCEPGKALSREGKLNFKDLFLPPPPPPSSSQVLPSSSSSHSEHRKPSLAVDTSPPGSPRASSTKLSRADSRSKSPSPMKKPVTPMKKILSSKVAVRGLKPDKHCPTG